jgi:hypothetical protein
MAGNALFVGVVSAIRKLRLGPSMRRPVPVKSDPLSLLFPRPFSQAGSVATLPSALVVSDFRSVPVGCSRFSRRCHLVSVLRFPLYEENSGQDLVAVTKTRQSSSAVRYKLFSFSPG